MSAATWELSAGSQERDYALYSLVVELERLPAGSYEFETIELVFEDGSKGVWDIGHWVVAVRPHEPPGTQFVRLGKHSALSGELDWNRFELTNIADSDIRVVRLEFSLPGVSTAGVIQTSDTFEPGGESTDPELLLLEPGLTRTFQVEVAGHIDPLTYFTIKPRLVIEVNGKQVLISMPPVVYGKWYVDDEQVRVLLETGRRSY